MFWRSACLSLAMLLAAHVAHSEEHVALNWPSRIIQLKAETTDAKPPVVSALSLHRAGLLATAGDDHVVRVFDLSKGTMVQRLEGHDDWVRTIAYSPVGDLLASAGNDKRILFWNALSGDKLKIFAELPSAIAVIIFSADGKYLAATGFEDKVRVYEVATGELVVELDGTCRDMHALAFSPDGRYLAAGGRNGKVRVWTWQNKQVAHEDEQHKQRIRSIEFSPDGSLLASCGDDRQVIVRPMAGGTAFALPRRPAKIMAMAFSGNAQIATAGSDNLIRLWDLGTKQEMGRLTGHTGTVAALVFGDKTLISSGFDTTVRVWNMETNVAREPGVIVPRVGRRGGGAFK
jgi:WD40 repeat protein